MEPNKKKSSTFLDVVKTGKITRPRVEKTTKIVNTKVPLQVFTVFDIYCSLQNQFRKDIFPIMLKHFLKKHKEERIQRYYKMGDRQLNFTDLAKVNFEYPIELEQSVKELKARQHIKYMDMYTQVILHFINDHNIEIKF
jgi:hypothetical protein